MRECRLDGGDKAGLDEGTLQRLAGTHSHRGPDGDGFWLTTTANGRSQIALGHCRLSIIDLEGSAQPMQSHHGGVTLIFNGEIYNYVDLREELQAIGHICRTNSDSEVLIEATALGGGSRRAVPRHVRLCPI